MELLALAIPFFLLLMGVEYYFSTQKGKKYYKFTDTVSNLSIGIFDRLCGLIFAGSFYFVYQFLHKHFALFTINQHYWQWILLFVLVDFLWYWYHRFSHTVNIFWAQHVVHHSSTEFNFAVGTRITIFQSFVRMLFWCILPVVGFPAEMILGILAIHGAYSFFTHTRTIGKLGFLEKIIVTPSHHRVHHASNDEYIDKNYGGFFIVWDKLFGTFAEEKEAVVFGLTTPLKSKSFLWQLFHLWVHLYFEFKSKISSAEKLKIVFGKPVLLSKKTQILAEKRFLSAKAVGKISTLFKKYVVFQMALSLVCITFLIYFWNYLNVSTQIFSSLLLIITLVNCGAVMEQLSWVFDLELFRGLILLVYLSYDFPETFAINTIVALLALTFYTYIKEQYFSYYLLPTNKVGKTN